jgi:hypothetical protein
MVDISRPPLQFTGHYLYFCFFFPFDPLALLGWSGIERL